MSSISGFSSSRGNYAAVLRPAASSRKDAKPAAKAAKEPKVKAAQAPQANEAKAGKKQAQASEEPASIAKQPADAVLGKRLDELDSKYAEVSKKLDSALGNDGGKAELDALGSKFDNFAESTSQRFDNVDSKLNDLTNQLGDRLDSVVIDLSTAITELKVIVKQGTASSGTQLSNTVNALRNDFNKQFSDLKAQHESETNALLQKLNDVTEQLKTLSEQSAEQISVLKDQLGGLGGQLGTILGKLDLLGKGQNMSLHTIGLFDVAAKAGNGALDRLVGAVGTTSTGSQLRSVQSRLQFVSSRFGIGQPATGFNLLA